MFSSRIQAWMLTLFSGGLHSMELKSLCHEALLPPKQFCALLCNVKVPITCLTSNGRKAIYHLAILSITFLINVLRLSLVEIHGCNSSQKKVLWNMFLNPYWPTNSSFSYTPTHSCDHKWEGDAKLHVIKPDIQNYRIKISVSFSCSHTFWALLFSLI